MARRLQREFLTTRDKFPFDIELENDSLYRWVIALHGPDQTPYFGGTFLIELEFPTNYPLVSPTVRVITKIFHPSVAKSGAVCLAMLGTGWKIEYTPAMIIDCILEMLKAPGDSNVMYPEVFDIYKSYPVLFNKMASEWTVKYGT
jgi:ubiquitin-protein ligase